LIIILPTSFSPEVAEPSKNMVLRAQDDIKRLVLGEFVIKAGQSRG